MGKCDDSDDRDDANTVDNMLAPGGPPLVNKEHMTRWDKELYMNPIMKIALRPSLAELDIFSPQIVGIGRLSIMASVTTLNAPMAMKDTT